MVRIVTSFAVAQKHLAFPVCASRRWHFHVKGAMTGEAVQRENVDFHGCEECEDACVCLLDTDRSRR